MLDLNKIFKLDEEPPTIIESAASTDTAARFARLVEPTHKELTTRVNQAVGSTWPAALADFVLLLSPGDLPATPFEFGGPHCIVTDRRKFLTWLKSDVRRGAEGARARFGAIQTDIERLHGMLLTNT